MYSTINDVPENKLNDFINDAKTPALITRWKVIRNLIKGMVFVPGILWTIGVFYHTHEKGIGNTVFAAFITLILGRIIANLIDKKILIPLMYKRYQARADRMDEEMRAWGTPNAYIYRWSYPTPGFFGIDSEQRLILFCSEETNYSRTVIYPEDVETIKIKEEKDLHTKTYHSGRWNYWNNSGMSYTGGGTSTSVTVSVDRVYLEMSYSLEENSIPEWFVAPYQTLRKEAETMMIMFEKMKQ